jgi:hypothetical protein
MGFLGVGLPDIGTLLGLALGFAGISAALILASCDGVTFPVFNVGADLFPSPFFAIALALFVFSELTGLVFSVLAPLLDCLNIVGLSITYTLPLWIYIV